MNRFKDYAKRIVDPVSGEPFYTVEHIGNWEGVFEELGATKHPFGFYTAAGWMAEKGKSYEFQPSDYENEEPHGGEELGNCVSLTFRMAIDRSLPFVSGFAVSHSGAWVPHCWNLNDQGRVLDLTWHCPQYEVALDRQYIGRRIKNFNDKSNPMFDVLFDDEVKADVYQGRFSYVLHQVARDRYIVRDWWRFAGGILPKAKKFLRGSEFTNQLTIRECEDIQVRQLHLGECLETIFANSSTA